MKAENIEEASFLSKRSERKRKKLSTLILPQHKEEKKT